MLSEKQQNYSKKRQRPSTSTIEEAVTEIVQKGQSINKTALSLIYRVIQNDLVVRAQTYS